MNIKKNYKTIILFTSIIINISLIIGLCVSINGNAQTDDNSPISLVEQGEDVSIESSAKRYIVGKDDFNTYYNWNANFVFNQSPYEHVSLDNLNIEIGDILSEGSSLGSIAGEEVKIKSKGTVVNIVDNEGIFDVTIYYFNQYEIALTIDLDTYYSVDMTNLVEPTVHFAHGMSMDISFDRFDFSSVENNEIVYAYYLVAKNDLIISPSTSITAESIKENIGEYLYIKDSDFYAVQEVKKMNIVDGEKVIDVDVYCIAIYGDYAFIGCDDYVINEGTVLYE